MSNDDDDDDEHFSGDLGAFHSHLVERWPASKSSPETDYLSTLPRYEHPPPAIMDRLDYLLCLARSLRGPLGFSPSGSGSSIHTPGTASYVLDHVGQVWYSHSIAFRQNCPDEGMLCLVEAFHPQPGSSGLRPGPFRREGQAFTV